MSDFNINYVQTELDDLGTRSAKLTQSLGKAVKKIELSTKRIGDLNKNVLKIDKTIIKLNDNIKVTNTQFRSLQDRTVKLKTAFEDVIKLISKMRKKTPVKFEDDSRDDSKPAEEQADTAQTDSGGGGDGNNPTDRPADSAGGGDKEDKQEKERSRISKAFNATVKANTQAIKNLGLQLISNYTIANKLKEAVMAFEQQQLQSFAMGIDNARFMEQNNQLLADSRVGQRELQQALIDNFGEGVRTNSEELISLTETMIATGQNTKALTAMNSRLVGLTGPNNNVVARLAESNEQLSDTFQVSNDKLINAVDALASQMDTAQFLGDDAIAGMGELAQDIAARAGGVDVTSEIATVVDMLDANVDNIAKVNLLGARDLAKGMMEGNVTSLAQLQPIIQTIQQANQEALAQGGDSVEAMAAARQVAMAQFNMSEKQFNAILKLGKINMDGNEVNEEARIAQEQEFESIKNVRQKTDDFFTQVAPDLHKMATGILPALAGVSIAINSLATAQSVGSMLDFTGGGKGSARRGALKAAGKMGLKGSALKSVGRFAGTAAKGVKALTLGGMAGLAIDQVDNVFGVEEGSTVDKVTDVGSDMATGASIGAMVGSIIPGLGTAIGGAIGAGIGGLYGLMTVTSEETEKTAEELEEINKREKQEAAKRLESARKTSDELSFMASYIRGTNGVTQTNDPLTQKMLEETNAKLDANKAAMEQLDKKVLAS